MGMQSIIKLKIKEYVFLLKQCNLVDNNVIALIEAKLNRLRIIEIEDAPGDAMITGDTLYICMKNIEKCMIRNGEYYFDEVLFHEFAHISNSFYESIYGEKAFNIRDCIESNFDNFTTVELLEQEDKLLYNQIHI